MDSPTGAPRPCVEVDAGVKCLGPLPWKGLREGLSQAPPLAAGGCHQASGFLGLWTRPPVSVFVFAWCSPVFGCPLSVTGPVVWHCGPTPPRPAVNSP